MYWNKPTVLGFHFHRNCPSGMLLEPTFQAKLDLRHWSRDCACYAINGMAYGQRQPGRVVTSDYCAVLAEAFEGDLQ